MATPLADAMDNETQKEFFQRSCAHSLLIWPCGMNGPRTLADEHKFFDSAFENDIDQKCHESVHGYDRFVNKQTPRKYMLEEMKHGVRNVMKIILRPSKPHGGLALPRLPFTKNKRMTTFTELTNHSVQPSLLEKHSTTLKWLSATIHWKSELAFFQKILKKQKRTDLATDVKREFDYFDNQFVYLTEEAIEDLRKKLRNQESRLARMFETKIEWDTQYYKEHDSLMEDATKLSELITKLIDSHRRWITKLQSQSRII